MKRLSKRVLFITAVALIVLMLPTMALCAEEEAAFPALDNLWVLIAAFMVFFMQAGFAMVETGFTRAKNAGNIIMKNMMDFSVGSIFYWLFGFAIMFGISETGVLGSVGWFGDVSAVADAWGLGGISPETFLLFQTVFCATAATIVSGAMAERTKFSSYLIYSAVISLIVYPIVGRWTWGGGWLAEKGFVDFAGSTVVHSVGGWAALVGALALGPRIGKYTKDGKAKVIPGHSLTLGALGVFILWFGWFGFNPGSELAADEVIGSVAVNTNLAAAAGAVAAMLLTWVKYKKPDVSMTLNGALAGLVGITAGCANVNATGAAIIGLIAGFVVVLAVEFIDKTLKIDDPVGAASVHGVCGALGTLLVGLFDTADGLLYGGGAGLLGTQAIGVLSVAAWTVGMSLILFYGIKFTVGLRVSEKEELEGLDLHEHGSLAYGDFVTKTL